MPPAPGGATLASHLAMIGVAVSLTLGRCGRGFNAVAAAISLL